MFLPDSVIKKEERNRINKRRFLGLDIISCVI